MITEEEATRLLKRADPARGVTSFAFPDATDYLAALPTRSTTVTLIDTEPNHASRPGRHRWPMIALAAAAVVAIVVGALVARDDDRQQVPADTTVAPEPTTTSTTAAVEVARGFLDAFVAKDADRALPYLSDDAITKFESDWESPDAVRRAIAWTEAARFKIFIRGCEPRDGDTGGVTVRCDFDFHEFGSDEIGLGPYGESYWDFTIRDGQIVSENMELAFYENGSSEEMWSPFARWIKTEHPDDVPVMYQDSSQTSSRETDESLRLWEQRTAEYVQAVLTDREQHLAAVAVVCTTQADLLGQLPEPDDGALDEVAEWNTAAATTLQQVRGELNDLEEPPSTDTTPYAMYRGALVRLVRNFEATAEAATAGDTIRLAELDAEYLDVRRTLSSAPPGSGLEECLASLPS